MSGSVTGPGAGLPAPIDAPATPTPVASPAPAPASPAATPLVSELFKGEATLEAVARGEKTLDVGARGEGVKRLQEALNRTGTNLGTPDGIFGRLTASGLSAMQRAAGLTPTGKLDAATLRALDAKLAAVTPGTGGLASLRFSTDADFVAVAAGRKTMARGARGADVTTLQLSLLGLGHAVQGGADGVWGAGTTAALKRFQSEKRLPETGKLDKATLAALDAAAAAKVAELKAASPQPQQKVDKYRVVADLKRCRAYVVEKGTDKPVASYLISPGTAEFPTRGTSFTIQSTQVAAWWRPPSGDWAEGLEPSPPGLENPMGICKLSFGAYAEYFHGIPKHEEKDLGKAASHGCCRMSGANVLEFHENYAGAGTKVDLIRDAATSDRLAASFAAAGVADRPIAAGVEYSAAYASGEMGQNETLRAGKIVVGGRGG